MPETIKSSTCNTVHVTSKGKQIVSTLMCQLSVTGSPFRFRLIFSFNDGASFTV